MTDLLLHPVLPYAVALALAPLAGAGGRRLLSLAAPLLGLWSLSQLQNGAGGSVVLAGMEWEILRVDALSRVFALAFLLYSFAAGVFAWREEGKGPKLASLGVAGAGVGVVLAGDFLSLFLAWEWLTVTSLFLIWFGRGPASFRAGMRYLLFHLAGATALLVGILLLRAEGITSFDAMAADRPATWLVLGGFLVNAALPPLHAWLADAYPRASIFGTVFLAAFTTKAAVYALARGFPGTEPLVWLGTAMALFGVVYAVLENDIRRLLGYHIISQVGYMVAGVGLGSAVALNGTAAHAFSHIFYKGLLMMSAGAVIYATGKSKLTELGGLAHSLRWPLFWMMIGAFSISGVPYFNGYVSKSMVVSAATYAGRGEIELLLLLASMGTFLHTGLKLPWFTFFGKDQGARVQRPVPLSMHIAMGLCALVCIATGIAPTGTLYALLPEDYLYKPFTAHHFVEAMQLLVGTALGFWLLRSVLGGEATSTRDVDRLYRGPVRGLVAGLGAAAEGLGAWVRRGTTGSVALAYEALLRYRNGTATMGVATMGLAVVALLAAAGWLAAWFAGG